MKLLEPTQKYKDVYSEGILSENHKFWFNLDLSFIARSDVEDERKMKNFDEYKNTFGLELTFDELMENFNVPFDEFIENFKDVPKIYNTFNFKEK